MQHRSTRRVHSITRGYQAAHIGIPISVDADDLKYVVNAVNAANTKNAVNTALAPAHVPVKYTLEFTPDEHSLNAAKDTLGEMSTSSGKTREYLKFRRAMDIYMGLKFIIEKQFGEKNASNAFLKYYELASTYMPLFIGDARSIVSFFNAELPGSSLVAFNQYMRGFHPNIAYEWYASSLVTDELVDGSRAFDDTYGYVQHNRSRWLMSANNNGDMTVVENILDVAARIGIRSSIGGVDIYSHDAGIDVSGGDSGEIRYDDQENANSILHLGCALAGFLTMKVGALFIAKQYTFYSTFTWNLILIYATLFDSFYLTKPLTSRPTNSEMYLVGVGFKGIDAALTDMLIARIRTRDTSPLLTQESTRRLPAVSDLQKFTRIVYGQQRAFLLEMSSLYKQHSVNDINTGTYALKKSLIENWLRKYPMKPISASDRIASN